MKRVFSAIRPSGDIHIGNYLGTIKQWKKLQNEYECFFCIADLHAITTPFEPKILKKNIKELAIVYLSAGLEPEKCVIFVQSQIKEHTELAWILGTITPLGDLKRMTQFKEKAKKHKDYVNAGLLNYPLLMASDILLYQTELVPVGKDQVQHIELTREIAKKFNKKFGEVFKIPQFILSEKTEKIMSLKDPKKKMSKTDSPAGCIGLFDSCQEIKTKIMSALTDTGKTIKYDPLKKPGISNLLAIYSGFSEKPIKELEIEFRGKNYEFFKKSLAKLLIEKLEIFRKKKEEFEKREVFITEILEKGRKKAESVAKETINKVKERLGLIF